MTPYQIVEKAKEFGILPESALNMRIRYLREEVKCYMEAEKEPVVWLHFALLRMQEVVELEKYLKREKEVKSSDVTADMIARAKSYPVELLVEFKRGTALCFNHEERTPSLNHDRKHNRAHCFGQCNQSWDSIDILMIRDGLNFRAAVKRLQ